MLLAKRIQNIQLYKRLSQQTVSNRNLTIADIKQNYEVCLPDVALAEAGSMLARRSFSGGGKYKL